MKTILLAHSFQLHISDRKRPVTSTLATLSIAGKLVLNNQLLLKLVNGEVWDIAWRVLKKCSRYEGYKIMKYKLIQRLIS